VLHNNNRFRPGSLLQGLRHEGRIREMLEISITAADIEKFSRRAEVCRAEADMTWEPAKRQERLETALAYERWAERGKRHLGLAE
jgi:hypothetical protein